MKQLNTNLKLSNKTNLDLIQKFIFYINETTNDDLMEITTHNIKLKFNNSTIKISDYITQIKSFSKLLKTFEEQTDLSQHYKISHDTLNESENRYFKYDFHLLYTKYKFKNTYSFS